MTDQETAPPTLRYPIPDLDLTTDTWTDDERAKMMRWYEVAHGTGDSRLAPFVPFLIDNAPRTFKRYRALVPALVGAVPRGIFFVHLYAIIGNAHGCGYEIVAARLNGGLSKRQVIEVLEYAFLTGGPPGMNPVAEGAAPYLQSWEDERERGDIRFPEGWEIAPEKFASGIDWYSTGFADGEADLLYDWHRRMSGRVPRYVEFWASKRPRGYKATRARYEAAIGQNLPAQLFPLLTMHAAAFLERPPAVLQAVEYAKAVGGITQEQILEILETVFVYGAESKMVSVLTDEVIDVLEGWDA